MSSTFGGSETENTVYETLEGEIIIYTSMGTMGCKMQERFYKADSQVAEKILAYIEEVNLKSYEGKMAAGLMGGMVSVEFRDGDRQVIINSSNIDSANVNILYKVGNLITQSINPDMEVNIC